MTLNLYEWKVLFLKVRKTKKHECKDECWVIGQTVLLNLKKKGT
jgi:hypothetical protein